MTTLTKQTMRCLLTLGIVLTLCACSTTKRDWNAAKSKGTITAYEEFLKSHPKARQAKQARWMVELMSAELDWGNALSISTIDGYRDYISKHPNSRRAKQARERLNQLEVPRDWKLAKSAASIESYKEFIQKHPKSNRVPKAKQEMERMEAERDWKLAINVNTLRAFEEFLKNHPTSQYISKARIRASEARIRQEEVAFHDAVIVGTDEALIAFIKEFDASALTQKASKKLKDYEPVNTGEVIPWSAIPSVYAGEASSGDDHYSCGINMLAFSIPPHVEHKGVSLMVGTKRFFKPNTATLHFKQWSSFDSYSAKGVASISSKGLAFHGNSIILRKR